MTVDVQSYFPPLLRLLKEMGYLYVQAMEQHFHFPNGLGKAMHDGYDENLFLENASGDQEGNYSHSHFRYCLAEDFHYTHVL